MFKLICEGLIQNFKMFDSDVLNTITDFLIIYITYPYAWKVIEKLKKLSVFEIRWTKSLGHWIIRFLAGILLFWVIKVSLVLCILIQNKIYVTVLFDALLYFLYCSIMFSYLERKKNSSYNKIKGYKHKYS